VDQLLADEQVHYDSGQFVTDALLWTLTDNQNTVRDLATYNSGTRHDDDCQSSRLRFLRHETSQTNSAVDCLFGYTGRAFDKASGEQNNLDRWYEAVTGRWLSEDPAAADVNLYRYCGNSPTIHVDPSGLVVWGDGSQVGGTIPGPLPPVGGDTCPAGSDEADIGDGNAEPGTGGRQPDSAQDALLLGLISPQEAARFQGRVEANCDSSLPIGRNADVPRLFGF